MATFRALSVWLLLYGVSVHAEQDGEDPAPAWELGAGFGGQFLADYRGSDHYQIRAIPFPLVAYQGDFLKADDEGIRGELFAGRAFEFNVSADLSLANGDGEGTLRQGMPELLPTFEVGPDFAVNLTGSTVREGWALHLPLRGAVATDLSRFDYVGLVFNPNVTYRKNRFAGDWNLVGQLGLLYGNDDYHDYFYTVLPEYQTDNRANYQATSGFGGTVFKLGVRRRYGQLWVGGTLRYDCLEGAAFSDSPLVENPHYFSMAIGVGWYFWHSQN